MFEIQKAKSRKTDVEYIEVSIKSLIEYAFAHTSEDSFSDEQSVKEVFSFTLTDKSKIQLEKVMTKKTKRMQRLGIFLKYIAWFDGERPVYWQSGMTFLPNGDFECAVNCKSIEVAHNQEFNPDLLYIVADYGFGFHAKNTNDEPYFLNEPAFEYVYEKVS